MSDTWRVGDRTLSSRLLLGTGKFSSAAQMVASVTASGAGVFACKDCLRVRLEAMTVGAYLLKPRATLPWGKITS